MKLKVLSLFSGIGAFEKALKNVDVGVDLVNYCEIDKYASKAYSLIHGVPESMNLWDVTKIDTSTLPNDIDLITYGFPCQDISLAGKQKGFEHDGERTRSGLFFEALRIIEDTKPKFAIAENVKNLTSKRFANEFKIVLDSLEQAGYANYWKVLNAKNYGIPQNRERVFIISIRKDIDKGFEFPEPFPLELRLKDMLEDEVDEKFYLSDERIENLIKHKRRNKEKGNGFGARFVDENDISSSLLTNPDKTKDYLMVETSETIKVGNTSPGGKSQCNDVYEVEGLYPNICAGTHGNCNPSILVREATKKGYVEAVEGDSINLEHPNSKTRRGRVGKSVAQTLTTSCNQGVVLNE